MDAVGKVDTGKKRSTNQDAFLVSKTPVGILPNLYIVADGMGGHKAGEVASRLAIEVFCDYMKNHEGGKSITEKDLLLLLKMGVAHANYQVYKQSLADERYRGMGTTMTLCTIINQKVYIAHVGDTRLYSIADGQIEQITTDHSLVQEMYEQGCITTQDMSSHPQRHVITRAVGTYETVKVDTLVYNGSNCPYLLLCSDGLTTMLKEEEILQIVCTEESLEEKTSRLIAAANERGGLDNIAVILGKMGEVKSQC